MKTVLDYKLKKVGRPRISKGTLFLEGYGISIKINDKRLLIRNGKEQEETWLEIRNGSYNLPQESYFTGLTDRADFDRIIIQGSGYITFDAMQWLTEWGISVIMIDRRGKLYGNFNQVSGNTEPLIRQKQYDCFRNENKLEYLRKWVVSHKVFGNVNGNNASKRWLIMHKELTKRYVKILGEILEAKRYQKAHVGRHTEHGFQDMREITIMKMRCLELRDYILERKKSLSQPQKMLSR